MKSLFISALFLVGTITNQIYAQENLILKRSNDAEPSTLDPQLAQGIPEMHILRDLFEGLVTTDPSGNIIPGAAEKWSISEDGKTYTFHLRDNYWSDGVALTAEDFVYAWQRAVDPIIGSNYSFILYPVKNAEAITKGETDISELGIHAIDEHTLEITLENPTPYFIGLLVNSVTYPVPKHVIKTHGSQWSRVENMVSNGAFTLTEWIPQATIKLTKSTQYWDANNVNIDGVNYYVADDKNSELARYRAGELDWTSDVPNEQMQWMQDNLGDELHIHNYLGTYYYGFNLTKAPFKDNPKLREALTLAVDREMIVENITASGENPAYGFVVPGVSHYHAYVPAYAKLSKDKRIARAKRLYQESGYSQVHPLEVEILYNTNENNKKIAIAIAAMWKETLGVKVNLVNQEWKVYLNNRREKNTEVFRASWIGDYDDANTFLELWVSSSGSNSIGLADPEYDALISKASETLNMQDRARLLRQAEQRLIDQYALIPIYFYVSKHLIKPYVGGYQENVMNYWPSKYFTLTK